MNFSIMLGINGGGRGLQELISYLNGLGHGCWCGCGVGVWGRGMGWGEG